MAKKRNWKVYIVIALLLATSGGWLFAWLDNKAAERNYQTRLEELSNAQAARIDGLVAVYEQSRKEILRQAQEGFTEELNRLEEAIGSRPEVRTVVEYRTEPHDPIEVNCEDPGVIVVEGEDRVVPFNLGGRFVETRTKNNNVFFIGESWADHAVTGERLGSRMWEAETTVALTTPTKRRIKNWLSVGGEYINTGSDSFFAPRVRYDRRLGRRWKWGADISLMSGKILTPYLVDNEFFRLEEENYLRVGTDIGYGW